MKQLFFLVLMVNLSCCKSHHPKPEYSGESCAESWEILFDGTDVSQWRGIHSNVFPSQGWKVKDGELIVNATDGTESGNGGDIVTRKKYADFELVWEWKMLSKGGNSGVKYYVEEIEHENKKHGLGLEYQVLDDANHPWMLNGKMTPNDYHTLGSLYEIYPASSEKKSALLGEWNSSKIVSKNNHVEHWLNGKKILEYERASEDFRKRVAESKFGKYDNFGEAESGHILIQDHGSIVHYRSIKIRKFSETYSSK